VNAKQRFGKPAPIEKKFDCKKVGALDTKARKIKPISRRRTKGEKEVKLKHECGAGPATPRRIVRGPLFLSHRL
jgi:hypothetical protein